MGCQPFLTRKSKVFHFSIPLKKPLFTAEKRNPTMLDGIKINGITTIAEKRTRKIERDSFCLKESEELLMVTVW